MRAQQAGTGPTRSPSRRPGPRRRKPTAVRQREIAEAALEIIARHGLRRFTTSALAAATGTSESALFRHFASKADIVTAAIDRVEEVLFAGFPPTGADPIGRLGQFLVDRVEIVRLHPAAGAVMGSEQLSQASDAHGIERLRSFRARSGEFVRQCLAQARREGSLDPGLAPDIAMVLFMGSLFMLVHGPAIVGGKPSTAARALQVWAALERVLRGRGAPEVEDGR
jgi:AcrR family transcriptional regulator